jgi:hypothetical protein
MTMLIQKIIIDTVNWPETSQLYVKRALDLSEMKYLDSEEEEDKEYKEELTINEKGQFIFYSTYSNECMHFTVCCGRYCRNVHFVIGPPRHYLHTQTLRLVAIKIITESVYTNTINYTLERG